MSRHQYAKEILFESIGTKVGVYDKYSRYVKDKKEGRQNGGTHLVNSISNAWDEISNDNAFDGAEWQKILLQTDNTGYLTTKISRSISSHFFGPADTELLRILIEDGVKQAKMTLKYESHLI